MVHLGGVRHVKKKMDDADAQLLRCTRAWNIHQLTINANLPLVLLVHPRKYFHEGRFTRTVLSHKGMHFTGHQFKPTVIQGTHARKGLAQVLDGDKRGHRLASEMIKSMRSSRHRR